MTMTKYQVFMSQIGEDFRKETHAGDVPEVYVNEDLIGITLEQLEALDNKFIEQ